MLQFHQVHSGMNNCPSSQGYCEDQIHIKHLEIVLSAKGLLKAVVNVILIMLCLVIILFWFLWTLCSLGTHGSVLVWYWIISSFFLLSLVSKHLFIFIKKFFFGCTGSLWQHTGLVALWHVGSYLPNQGLSLHPGTGRRILNPWTAREVPHLFTKVYGKLSKFVYVLSEVSLKYPLLTSKRFVSSYIICRMSGPKLFLTQK